MTLAHSETAANGTPTAKKQLRFLIIGAGSRGTAYARAVTSATAGVIYAVAEPHDFKRRELGRNYIWGAVGQPAEGQEFTDWKDWLKWETARRGTSKNGSLGHRTSVLGVDGVFICTLDETHAEILRAIAPLHLHVLCEKPLALSLADSLLVYKSLLGASSSPSRIFSIGHVLRYSPHNILLRKLLLADRAIGDIVSLEHCEPVGWWHFSHSYVRGNWRRATANGDGSLLTKSCHDIDFILWLLSNTTPDTPAHHPRSISSFGALTQFRLDRKPARAGAATNCLSCPAEPECIYSAVRIYRDLHLRRNRREWPVAIVCPDIEDAFRSPGGGMPAAEQRLLQRLSEDYDREKMSDADVAARPWYGRCVYEADNDVCDDQVVTIAWDDEQEEEGPSGFPATSAAGAAPHRRTGKTATFHMIAPTEKQCERRGVVYGTLGELAYDSETITIYTFATGEKQVIDVPEPPPEERKSHGGGDYGLARSFVHAVHAVENEGWDVAKAQNHFVGCTLEEAVRSHAVVFAAEEARRDEKVVKWKQWWTAKLADAGIPTIPARSS